MASSLEKTDAQCISADKSDTAASSGLYFSPHSFHCFHCSRFSPPSDFVIIVNACPLTKLEGGLNLLHGADDDAVIWRPTDRTRIALNSA